MTLGQQVRTAREAKGLSQRALGELVGVTDKMISKIEREHTTTSGVIERLAGALGVRITFGDESQRTAA